MRHLVRTDFYKNGKEVETLIYIGDVCYLCYTSGQDIQMLLNLMNLEHVTSKLNI